MPGNSEINEKYANFVTLLKTITDTIGSDKYSQAFAAIYVETLLRLPDRARNNLSSLTDQPAQLTCGFFMKEVIDFLEGLKDVEQKTDLLDQWADELRTNPENFRTAYRELSVAFFGEVDPQIEFWLDSKELRTEEIDLGIKLLRYFNYFVGEAPSLC